MSSKRIRIALLAALVTALGAGSFAFASGRDHGDHHGDFKQSFGAVLVGGYETPVSIHTAGHGTLRLSVNSDKTMMSYTLTYSNLTSPASMAHIHFGQTATSGGIAIWLCGGGGKPVCPAGNTSTVVTVSGNIAASDVLAIAGQNLAAGDLTGIIQEIKAGFAYANVHTANFGGGEIRGQIGGGHHDEDDDD
jgi:hypothetical protein